MKNIIFLSLLALSTGAFANTYSLKCVASYNAEKIVDTEVKLADKEQNSTFAKFDEFQFILSSKGNNVIELQFVDIYEPSRNYATAMLNGVGTYVELSIWRKDMLMETRCTLQ
ncbi:MAG: hypothetical protein ACOYL6_05805 [Bacteriovoracaceae bacterium]